MSPTSAGQSPWKLRRDCRMLKAVSPSGSGLLIDNSCRAGANWRPVDPLEVMDEIQHGETVDFRLGFAGSSSPFFPEPAFPAGPPCGSQLVARDRGGWLFALGTRGSNGRGQRVDRSRVRRPPARAPGCRRRTGTPKERRAYGSTARCKTGDSEVTCSGRAGRRGCAASRRGYCWAEGMARTVGPSFWIVGACKSHHQCGASSQ